MDDTNNPENGIIEDSTDENITQENSENTHQVEDLTSWSNENESKEASVADHLKGLISKEQEQKDLEAVFEVPVKVSAVLGSASMPVHQLLKLGRGAVIELDRRIGEAIDIYVNNLLVARGEVVMVEDRLGITMTEIIKGKSNI